MPGILGSGPVNVRSFQLDALDALKAVGNPLEAPTLMLVKNNFGSPSKDTVIGDLEECDFTGYAAEAALVFGDAHTDTDGKAVIKAPSVTFTCTGSATINEVYGWALVNAAKTALYVAQSFSQAFVMGTAGQGLTVQPVVTFPDNM
jgi:hypothetical protein